MKRLVRTRMLGVVRGVPVTGPLSRSLGSSFTRTSLEVRMDFDLLRIVVYRAISCIGFSDNMHDRIVAIWKNIVTNTIHVK